MTIEKSRTRWKPEEDDVLIRSWGKFSIRQIAAMVGRSVPAIHRKSEHLRMGFFGESRSVYQDGRIITPFTIKNTGLGTLNGISLSAETATSGIEVSLENNYIPILLSGQEITSNLIINTNEFKDENAEIKIIAKVSSPSFQDQVKFLVKLIKGINEQESSAKEQIVFANKLFEGNPLLYLPV